MNTPTVVTGRELLPIEPFQDWLVKKRESYNSYDDFYYAMGAREKTIVDIVNGRRWNARKRIWLPKKGVTFDYVDKCLTREGTTVLNELYPLED